MRNEDMFHFSFEKPKKPWFSDNQKLFLKFLGAKPNLIHAK